MSRFQLTPIPEVRAYGVDQVLPDGRRVRIDTFCEAERDEAIKLVAILNRGGRRWSTSTLPRSSSSASSRGSASAS